jgi:predicted dehydrogenase
MNIGTHLVNNLLRLAGHCRSVTALGLTDGCFVRPDDVIASPVGMGMICGERLTALLHFDHNVTATLVQQRFPVVDSTAYGIEVLGTEGRLFWKSSGAWILPTPHFVPDGTHDRWTPLALTLPEGYDPESRADVSDYAYVDEYVRALDDDRDHECSGIEGRHVMEALMGILESAAYGRRVILPQEDRSHPLMRWRSEHGLGEVAPAPRDYRQWLESEDQRLGRE